eukprot:CAMPEP_0168530284 /NCGR_PEP_ID=MMETSP0405-20121227/14560_1 /TAXON_ID=498012 /ORGANISM="Trichosphaerium sp, Strain Am-I-7 wt" /LENGTH=437 /DNA_ID=CAMNT_0008554465 /DNA_START=157 /DNA_END=1470 /DNA_ORIENTATION=+
MYSQEVVDAYWAKQPETAKKSQQNNTETSKRKIAYSDRRKKSLSQLVTEKKPPEKTKPVKPKKVAIIKSKTSTQLDYEAICSKIIESNTVAILEVPQLVLVLGLQNETIDTARNKVMVATAQNSITLDAIQRCDVQDNAWLIKVPGPDVLILHKRTLEASFGKIFCYALDIKAAKKLAKKLKPQPQKTRKRKREDDEDSSSSKSYRPKKRVTKKGPPKKRGRPRKIVHKPLRRGSYQYGVSRIISRQMVSAGKWEYKLEMEPLDDDFREAVAVMSSDVYITGSGNQEEDIHNILSCRVERGETFYKVLWKGRREILLPESIMRLMYPVALQNYCERQANAQRVNGRTMGSSGYLTSRTAVYINDIEDNASSGLDDDTCMLVRALSRLKSGDGVSPPSSPNVSCSLEKLSEKASLEAPVTVSEKPSPEKQTATKQMDR